MTNYTKFVSLNNEESSPNNTYIRFNSDPMSR